MWATLFFSRRPTVAEVSSKGSKSKEISNNCLLRSHTLIWMDDTSTAFCLTHTCASFFFFYTTHFSGSVSFSVHALIVALTLDARREGKNMVIILTC